MSDVTGFGSLITGIVGSVETNEARNAALQQAAQAYQQFANIGLPPNLSAPLVLQQLKSAGTLTPEMEQLISQGPSALNAYQQNQQYTGAQTQALQSLLQRGQGGLTPTDIAAYNQLLGNAQQAAQGQQQALMQQYAARGEGGGGAQLAGELSAQQGADQNLYNAGLNIGGQANQAALQAMSQAGQLGGQLNSQANQLAEQKAASQNAINQFNTQNALGIQNYNTQAQNAAQQANLQNAQRIQDYNSLMANQEQQREANAQQQYWNSLYNLAGSKAAANLGQANFGMNAAQQQGQSYANIASGIGQAGQAFSPVFGSNNNKQNQPLQYNSDGSVNTGSGNPTGAVTGAAIGTDL